MRSRLQRLGSGLNDAFRRYLPDPFVFAIALTLLVGAAAWAFTDSGPVETLTSWYRGFWILLEFGMQMVLILATGYAIALSPVAARLVDRVATVANTPTKVYFTVVLVGGLLSLVSWGWVVVTAVLGRELARRVDGLDYAFLTACVYVSGQPWVGGLSSSIPLLLNTDGNFMIEQGVLASTLPMGVTLASLMNLAFVAAFLLVIPLLMVLLQPAAAEARDIDSMATASLDNDTVAVEADRGRGTSLSDRLNHSRLLSLAMAVMGLAYLVWHFASRGFDLDLNVMIFALITVGLIAHATPMRYVVAMQRACSNVSGIIVQYPFYAGIMGIMMFTGLGTAIAEWMAGVATLGTLPALAQAAGAVVNFAIPSAGGEWAVIGPAFVEATQTLTAGMPGAAVDSTVARVAMAVAYGETSTNLIQPFFFLVVLPVMGAGVKLEARDVMGYLVVPFAVIYVLTAAIVTWIPS